MGDREGPGCGLCGSPAALSPDPWGAGLPFRVPKATLPPLGGIRRLLRPNGREKFGEESGRPPVRHLWPNALKVRGSQLPSRLWYSASEPQVGLIRQDLLRPGEVHGSPWAPDLGSLAPHGGEGQLPWVLNGVPAWGEMPRMTPLPTLTYCGRSECFKGKEACHP